jgi:hypothetical protein
VRRSSIERDGMRWLVGWWWQMYCVYGGTDLERFAPRIYRYLKSVLRFVDVHVRDPLEPSSYQRESNKIW